MASDRSRQERLPLDSAKLGLVDWSPDGTLLLVSRRGEDTKWSVGVMHPDGTGERELLASLNTVPGLGGVARIPRFYYRRPTSLLRRPRFFEEFVDPPPIKSSGVLLLNVDGGPPRLILKRTKGERVRCPLSPDGKSVAVLIYDGPDKAVLRDVTMTHMEILDTDGHLLMTFRSPAMSTIRSLIDWR